jgi:hypothetical protein
MVCTVSGQQLADVSHAALMDAGRPDLAALVQWFEDDDGLFYLEPMDELACEADAVLMMRAEQLAYEWLRRQG